MPRCNRYMRTLHPIYKHLPTHALLPKTSLEIDGMSQTAPTTAAVRAQLASILESTAFRDSERHRKLLTFLVESTLRGEADGLKEFVIAAEVWGRDTSFDPRIHSTVRVEIGRLRARLDRYYAAAGAEDPIRLRIPTGGYVVVFESSGEPSPTEQIDRFEILE